MAVMPATLMAFGQLASDNEVTAMKATGVSLYRMILPVLAASVILGGFLVYYNNNILPESNHRLMNLMIAIGKMKPTIEIKENISSNAFKGYTILVREKNDKTGVIKDVQILEKKTGGIPTIIVAERGKMTFNEPENTLRFELEDGEIHEMPDPKDVNTYRKTLFKNYTLNIRDTDRELKRTDRSHRGDREMSAAMMQAKIEELQANIVALKEHMNGTATEHLVDVISPVMPEISDLAAEEQSPPPVPDPDLPRKAPRKKGTPAEKVLNVLENDTHILESNRNQIYRYGVEIHKKFSISFSCIIFVLLGAPLAIRSGKKGMTMAIGFSILFFLIYYVFLISGEKLADRRIVVPWLAMWMPNIIFTAAAAFLLHSTVREASTINWERFNILKRLRRSNGDNRVLSDSSEV
jgi:lipopolysaccharide export system permease protein